MVSTAPHHSNVPGKWRRLAAPAADDSVAGTPTGSPIVAGVIPPTMLHEDEVIILLVKPSLWFILLTSLRFILITILVGVLAVQLLGSLGNILPREQVAALAVLIVLGRLIWALLVWTSHIYLLTNQRIVTIKGVVNVTLFQAGLRKIQRTTLYKPIHERIFGLGTIGFATAGAAGDFDSIWIMIPHPLQTHEQIVAAIQRLQ